MVATVTLILVVVILLLAWKLIGLKREQYPPGPFPWPILGNRLLLQRLSQKYGAQHLAMIALNKRYGSDVISLHLAGSKALIISGNKLIQTVLKSELYDGRPWNEFIKLRNLGQKLGVTMNDGSDWKEVRCWLVQSLKEFGFGKQVMTDMLTDELVAVLDDLKNGGVRQLKTVFGCATINVLWRLSTGKRFINNSRLEEFMNLLERRTQAFDILGGLLTAFPWIRYIAPQFSGYKLLTTLNDELKQFLSGTIAERKKKHIVGNESDLIDKFLNDMAKNEGMSTMYTEDQLVMILIDIILAGFTTTSASLDFLFLSVAVHQEVQKKVHKEIDAAIPFDRLPTLADKPNLPYAEAIINEALRMWPIFPIIGPRRVLQDTYLDNYKIPKDSTVLLNIYSVLRDPDLYPEPDKFNPDRFIKNGVCEKDSSFLVFGKGKRRCPGEVMARAATFLLFVGVMQKFELLPVPGKGPESVEIVPGISLTPKPYEVLLVPRQPAKL